MKQTKTSSGLNFAFQGLIFYLLHPNKVRNRFPIFIHHTMSLCRDIFKLIQTTIYTTFIYREQSIVIRVCLIIHKICFNFALGCMKNPLKSIHFCPICPFSSQLHQNCLESGEFFKDLELE